MPSARKTNGQQTNQESQRHTIASDRAHDVLGKDYHALDAIFKPRSIAVIGATDGEGSVGRTILWNLIRDPFGGTVYPVNLKRPQVMGIKAYASVLEVPEAVDLAIVMTPAVTVPEVIRECARAGVKGAVVISSGFKEVGEGGKELEKETFEAARAGRIRLIGPNCLGVMCPHTRLNATFAHRLAQPGNVAFISQSGALCTAILDWSLSNNVGFSTFVSTGSMVDVSWGDLIDYLGNDPLTQSIVIYMESIGDARSFISAAREVALTKPIIVINAGRTEAASKAAVSHTGALTGSDEALGAAFRRCGVLRVDSIRDLFFMAEVLAKQPRPKGPRMSIVTNAGGPGVLACDALITFGGELSELTDDSMTKLNEVLPKHWSHGNPVDILGDSGADRYGTALETVAKDPNCDGLLAVFAPQGVVDAAEVAQRIQDLKLPHNKPLLASWMGGERVAAGEDILNRAGIPTFPSPDVAARIFANMWRYSYSLQGLYETPQEAEDTRNGQAERNRAHKMLQRIRKSGRELLTEYESKEILSAYGIPTVPTVVAATEADAVKAAGKIGYPVVVKLHSQTLTHKTDVDGVKLNLPNAQAVKKAFKAIAASVKEKAGAKHFQGVTVQPMVLSEGYELIVGSSVDHDFGPVLLFGAGGQLVEINKDRSLALPPLNTTLARRQMEQTRIYKALKGVRGRQPVDLAELERILTRFSRLVVEHRCIKEVDINPFLASPDGLFALDARVVLHGSDLPDRELPRPAIRPYPNRYVKPFTGKKRMRVLIRPIRPEDEPLMADFHKTLSDRSVYLRYFNVMKFSQRVAHERLSRMCHIDYDRAIALVAELKNKKGEREIVGVGRLTNIHGTDDAEYAILISDQCQGQGLGTELLSRLVEIGREEGVARIVADILPENQEMQAVSRKVGFTMSPTPDGELIHAEISLQEKPTKTSQRKKPATPRKKKKTKRGKAKRKA